ncbi:MAG: hypothetical protein HY816_22770 [Candidatus Wallbacteria bacterium]|nr:hypothetical protein [Candidatus Wallbacteria bacterium]
MTYSYQVYGLVLRLPFACPLLEEAPPGSTPDVEVTLGVVPERLDSPVDWGRSWQVEPDRYLMRPHWGAGHFLLQRGESITVQAKDGADEELLRFQFLGTVLAALLRQRGLLVMHGMSVETPDGAVTVAGDSGAGKSTALLTLLARGCRMLSDDLSALRLESGGEVSVLPGVPRIHLPRDSADKLNRRVEGLPTHPVRPFKSVLPASHAAAREPALLRKIYVLEPWDGDELRVTALQGGSKLLALKSHCSKPANMLDASGLFGALSDLASRVPVYRVQRPRDLWTCDELASALLATV